MHLDETQRSHDKSSVSKNQNKDIWQGQTLSEFSMAFTADWHLRCDQLPLSTVASYDVSEEITPNLSCIIFVLSFLSFVAHHASLVGGTLISKGTINGSLVNCISCPKNRDNKWRYVFYWQMHLGCWHSLYWFGILKYLFCLWGFQIAMDFANIKTCIILHVLHCVALWYGSNPVIFKTHTKNVLLIE